MGKRVRGKKGKERTSLFPRYPFTLFPCYSSSSLITYFPDPATNDLIFSTHNQRDCLGVKLMLFDEDPRRQTFFRIAIQYGHDFLRDDWSTIQRGIDKVDRAAAPFYAVLKHSRVHVEPGKRGQQTWMDIQNAIAICFDKIFREQSHVPGKTNDLDAAFVQGCDYREIMFFTRTTAAFDSPRFEPAFAGALQPGRFRVITNDQHDFSIRHAAVVYGIGQRQHV